MALSGIGTFVALGLNQIVAHLAKELRPYDTLHHVLVLVPKANDYAFPSDHAVIAGALVTSVLLVSRRAVRSHQRDHLVSDLMMLGLVSVVLGLLLCFRSGLRRSALSRRRGRRPLARRVRRDGCLVGSPDRLSDRGLRRAHSTRPSYRSPARSADGPLTGRVTILFSRSAWSASSLSRR
jgi:hypothetical protein